MGSEKPHFQMVPCWYAGQNLKSGVKALPWRKAQQSRSPPCLLYFSQDCERCSRSYSHEDKG